MLDMGWTEILLVGVVALIVVGPKDLPKMFRTFGQFVGKMRGMAREFQRSMNDAANEADMAEFKDIGKTLNDVRSIQTDAKSAISQGLNKIDQEIEKSADLKVEDINEDAPAKTVSKPVVAKPADTGTTADTPANAAAPVAEAAPSGPAPGDLVDEPSATPEPRTASGT